MIDIDALMKRMNETGKGETICLNHDECEALLILLEEREERIDIMSKGKTGEWKRMSDLPIETDDRFKCSNCGNVVHYHDRINLYTFNDYCGKCGSYNGFKFKDGDPE